MEVAEFVIPAEKSNDIFCEHGMRKYAVIVLCVLLVQLFTYFVPNNVQGTVTQESPDLDKATVFKFYDAWKADPKSIEASHPLVDGSGSDLTNNIYVSQAGWNRNIKMTECRS